MVVPSLPRICHNPKLLCVRGLPEEAEAGELLEYLNREFRRVVEPTQDNVSEPIQNVLVFGDVAVVGCSSARVADIILTRTRKQESSRRPSKPCPLRYGGRILLFGRPRNYVDDHPYGHQPGPTRRAIRHPSKC
jgi:hypothetical protein